MKTDRVDGRAAVVLAVLGMAAGGAMLALASGCSTVKGAGEDIQYASEKTAEALGGGNSDDDDD